MEEALDPGLVQLPRLFESIPDPQTNVVEEEPLSLCCVLFRMATTGFVPSF